MPSWQDAIRCGHVWPERLILHMSALAQALEASHPIPGLVRATLSGSGSVASPDAAHDVTCLCCAFLIPAKAAFFAKEISKSGA